MNQEVQALADEIKRTAVHYASSAAVGEPTFDIAVGMEKLIDRLAAMAQPPAGWVMVPAEPTPDMVKAGWHGADATRCYRAMLSAAPKPKDQPAIDMDELRRAVCLIGTIGTIDGHDVIRRNSALEIIDARIDRAST